MPERPPFGNATASNAIPVAQKFEQHGRKHRVAILVAFALLDAQHHAFGIDVGHLQRDNLGDAQPSTIGDTERRAALYSTLGAASRKRATSSGLKTTGTLRGSRMNDRCLARSGLSSVT
jgi:hypothetical protein